MKYEDEEIVPLIKLSSNDRNLNSSGHEWKHIFSGIQSRVVSRNQATLQNVSPLLTPQIGYDSVLSQIFRSLMNVMVKVHSAGKLYM